jgi:hypothetical protein
MPLIDLPDLDQNFESEPVPEGQYDVRVAKFEATESKAGKPMYKVMLIVEDQEFPNAAPVNFFLSIPTKNDEERAKTFKMQQMKRFLTAFSIPYEANGFSDEDVEGATARQLSISQAPPTEDGRVYNEVHLPRAK